MRCETSTPFGRPVVPDVYMMANGASAATDCSGGARSGRLLGRRGNAPASTVIADRRSAPQAAMTGIRSGSATTMRGLGVRQHVGQIVADGLGVHGNPDRTGARNREHHGERRLAVAQHERDAIARMRRRCREASRPASPSAGRAHRRSARARRCERRRARALLPHGVRIAGESRRLSPAALARTTRRARAASPLSPCPALRRAPCVARRARQRTHAWRPAARPRRRPPPGRRRRSRRPRRRPAA